MPVFEIARTMECYFTGAVIVAPAELWKTLWQLFRESAFQLIGCGLIDDDQTLLVKRPDLFELHPAEYFFSPIKECGGAPMISVRKK